MTIPRKADARVSLASKDQPHANCSIPLPKFPSFKEFFPRRRFASNERPVSAPQQRSQDDIVSPEQRSSNIPTPPSEVVSKSFVYQYDVDMYGSCMLFYKRSSIGGQDYFQSSRIKDAVLGDNYVQSPPTTPSNPRPVQGRFARPGHDQGMLPGRAVPVPPRPKPRTEDHVLESQGLRQHHQPPNSQQSAAQPKTRRASRYSPDNPFASPKFNALKDQLSRRLTPPPLSFRFPKPTSPFSSSQDGKLKLHNTFETKYIHKSEVPTHLTAIASGNPHPYTGHPLTAQNPSVPQTYAPEEVVNSFDTVYYAPNRSPFARPHTVPPSKVWSTDQGMRIPRLLNISLADGPDHRPSSSNVSRLAGSAANLFTPGTINQVGRLSPVLHDGSGTRKVQAEGTVTIDGEGRPVNVLLELEIPVTASNNKESDLRRDFGRVRTYTNTEIADFQSVEVRDWGDYRVPIGEGSNRKHVHGDKNGRDNDDRGDIPRLRGGEGGSDDRDNRSIGRRTPGCDHSVVNELYSARSPHSLHSAKHIVQIEHPVVKPRSSYHIPQLRGGGPPNPFAHSNKTPHPPTPPPAEATEFRRPFKDDDRLPASLWFLAGGVGPPIIARQWKMQKPPRRMGGLLGMALHGHKAGMKYAKPGHGGGETNSDPSNIPPVGAAAAAATATVAASAAVPSHSGSSSSSPSTGSSTATPSSTSTSTRASGPVVQLQAATANAGTPSVQQSVAADAVSSANVPSNGYMMSGALPVPAAADNYMMSGALPVPTPAPGTPMQPAPVLSSPAATSLIQPTPTPVQPAVCPGAPAHIASPTLVPAQPVQSQPSPVGPPPAAPSPAQLAPAQQPLPQPGTPVVPAVTYSSNDVGATTAQPVGLAAEYYSGADMGENARNNDTNGAKQVEQTHICNSSWRHKLA